MKYKPVQMFPLRIYQDISNPDNFVGALIRETKMFARNEDGSKGEFIRTKEAIHIFGFEANSAQGVREKAERYWNHNQALNAAAHDAKQLRIVQAQSRRKPVTEEFIGEDGEVQNRNLQVEIVK